MASKSSPQVAVDTNFLLDLAEGKDIYLDALQVLIERGCKLVATPTVLQELAYLAQYGDKPERGLAMTALGNYLEWGFRPIVLSPVQNGYVEIIGDEIRARGIIPHEERHDSFVLAEAALSECDLLVSSDPHLKDAQFVEYRQILTPYGARETVIFSPHKVLVTLKR